MHTSPASRLLAAAALLTALGLLAAPALAQKPSAADVPKNSYYKDPLTPAERGAIAEEEDVSPNDGRPSVPAPQDEGVIPDAADDQKGDGKAAGPGPAPKKPGETEAQVILDDAKKNVPVSPEALAKCIKDWDPQTQMSKQEWAESCRTTLQYFPEEKD
jgi:hypothetical protein